MYFLYGLILVDLFSTLYSIKNTNKKFKIIMAQDEQLGTNLETLNAKVDEMVASREVEQAQLKAIYDSSVTANEELKAENESLKEQLANGEQVDLSAHIAKVDAITVKVDENKAAIEKMSDIFSTDQSGDGGEDEPGETLPDNPNGGF